MCDIKVEMSTTYNSYLSPPFLGLLTKIKCNICSYQFNIMISNYFFKEKMVFWLKCPIENFLSCYQLEHRNSYSMNVGGVGVSAGCFNWVHECFLIGYFHYTNVGFWLGIFTKPKPPQNPLTNKSSTSQDGALCYDIFLMASKESITVCATCRRTQLYYKCIIWYSL